MQLGPMWGPVVVVMLDMQAQLLQLSNIPTTRAVALRLHALQIQMVFMLQTAAAVMLAIQAPWQQSQQALSTPVPAQQCLALAIPQVIMFQQDAHATPVLLGRYWPPQGVHSTLPHAQV
jgi:hypothetical protein